MEERTPLFVNESTPDENLYTHLFRFYYRNNKVYMITGILFFGLFAICAFCQLYGNLFMPEEEDNWFVFLFFVLLASVIYNYCFNGHKLRARQEAKKRDLSRMATVMRFYEEELELETRKDVTTLPLSLFGLLAEDEECIVFSYEQSMIPVYKKGFTVGTAEEFSAWAKDHLPKGSLKKKK